MHYAVMVFGPDPVEQLEPYWDQMDVEPYPVGTLAEVVADDRRGTLASVACMREQGRDPEPWLVRWAECSDAEYWEQIADQFDHVDAEGMVYSTVNQEGRWDYWRIGGRWEDSLTTRDGAAVTEAVLGDLDLDRSQSPFALVGAGQIRTCRGMTEGEWEAAWRRELEGLPPSTLVTILDAHG